MCPVYIIKKKKEKALIADINKRIDSCNKELFDLVDSEIEKMQNTDVSPIKEIDNKKGDYIDELKRLKELLDSGIISQQEFDEKKERVVKIKS